MALDKAVFRYHLFSFLLVLSFVTIRFSWSLVRLFLHLLTQRGVCQNLYAHQNFSGVGVVILLWIGDLSSNVGLPLCLFEQYVANYFVVILCLVIFTTIMFSWVHLEKLRSAPHALLHSFDSLFWDAALSPICPVSPCFHLCHVLYAYYISAHQHAHV